MDGLNWFDGKCVAAFGGSEQSDGRDTPERGVASTEQTEQTAPATTLGRRLMEILLVEDNPGDVRLTKEALKGVAVPHRLHVARDGMEALAFLHHEGDHADAPTPDIILLDLNLPRLGGREVLGNIKGDPGLRHIPVVVVTTSEADHDVLHAYHAYANCYVSKPMDLDRFMHVVQNVVGFFSTIASLPPH